MPSCTIDGRSIEVPQGTTIIQAAQRLGIHVPHFCWHPDLAVDGNCRMCMVDVEKAPRLMIACNTQVSDGMVVQTRSERAAEAQRTTLEFLLINHPIDCPVCDQAGECYLQDQYMDHGLHDSQVEIEEKVRKRKVVDLGPIVLDSERCVLCSRCIRFEKEVTGTNSFEFVNRGDQTRIATFQDRPIGHGYAGNLADVCPVGALLSQDFRFKMRVWFLKQTESVCPGCSTGCNITIDHRDGEPQRLRPRRNPEVNRSWMCDEGRALYQPLAVPERLGAPQLRRASGLERVSWAAALDAVAERLKGARTAFVATPQASNEELFAFRALARAVSGQLDFRVGDPQARLRERLDGVLLRADRNPNTQGALELGMGEAGIDAIVAACRAGEIDALVLQGPELLEAFPDLQAPFVALMASHDTALLQRAHAVLPVALWAESAGSFTNFQRRVQRFKAAFPPPDEARPRWEIALELLGRLGAPLPAGSARELFVAMAREVPAYAGLDHRALGELGHPLEVSPEAALGAPA